MRTPSDELLLSEVLPTCLVYGLLPIGHKTLVCMTIWNLLAGNTDEFILCQVSEGCTVCQLQPEPIMVFESDWLQGVRPVFMKMIEVCIPDRTRHLLNEEAHALMSVINISRLCASLPLSEWNFIIFLTSTPGR